MIAKLKGILDALLTDYVILDVGGVGYRVFCSSKTMAKLAGVGHPAALFIETQVREDHIHLFGFADADEQNAFNLLITVQGVGARRGIGDFIRLIGHGYSHGRDDCRFQSIHARERGRPQIGHPYCQ